MENKRQFLIDNKDEILNLLNKNGHDKLNKTELTRLITEEFSIDIDPTEFDSFRRTVSKVIDSWLTDEFETQAREYLDEHDDTDYDQGEYDTTRLSELEYSDKYYYNKEDDFYLFFGIMDNPIKMTGTIIRDMKEMYSDMTGSKSSINEICREFEIPRRVLHKIKTYLGWTHDSDPFTDEEWLESDSESDMDLMVQSVIQKRKFNFYQKFSRMEQKEILNAANKWWQFNGGVINPFMEKFNEPASRKVEKVDLSDNGEPYALVMSPFDLHYGKYGWSKEVGVEYNRQIAREVLMQTTKAMLPDLAKYNIEKVYVPIGSDFYHVDTMAKTTTKGTPQDCDGTYVQIMSEGNELMLEWLDIIRQIAPKMEIYLAAGNHDYKLSHSLLDLVAASYRNDEDVYVHKDHHFRQYTKYGNCLIGFTHGDKTKLTKLPMQMAKEAKQYWGEAEHRVIFHGHLHHETIRDYDGVKLYQMPSLSGSDIWHHQHSWEGSTRGLAGYLIHQEKGVRVTFMENL